mgnify:CR=1 FL=1
MKILGFNIGGAKEQPPIQETPIIEKSIFNGRKVTNFNFQSDNKYLPSDYNNLYSSTYVRYGADNLFPVKLMDFYNSAPIHKSCVDLKTRLLFGDGIQIADGSNKVSTEVFLNNIDGYNNIDTLFNQIALDYILFGNYYLIATWNESFTKIIKVERLPAFGTRLKWNPMNNKPIGVVYNFDWKYKPNTYVEYPVFNVLDKNNRQQVIIGINNTLDSSVYNFPTYISGLNSIASNGAIGLFQLNTIENGFFPSVGIHYYGEPTPEEEDSIHYNLTKQFGGKRNSGKFLLFFDASPELKTTVEPIDQPNLDKTFTVIEESIQNNIIFAHGIVSPILVGISKAGSLGNNNELQNAFMLMEKMKVNAERKQIESTLNKILAINGMSSIEVKTLIIFEEQNNVKQLNS